MSGKGNMPATCARGSEEFGCGWTAIDELLDGPNALTAFIKGFGLENTVNPDYS